MFTSKKLMMSPITTTFDLLHSEEKLTLLDDIDKLRSQGISRFVHIPQLIVCGDQSSGKSSVLEAISGIPFPTKDNLCTRFATEVILRHNSDISISVTIRPGPNRSDVEKAKLLGFRYSVVRLEDFSSLVDSAQECIGVTDSSCAFSTDVLRPEITGPSQPHLTVVGLPGLIHSENELQTAADIQVVQSMVYEYMENWGSIILAIVSAKNDYANQIVLKLAR
jgi:GTPase SAR1 family protein